MTGQGPEHDELRRRAFSRDGTEDDRRRLAEYEARQPATPTSPAAAPEESDAGPPEVDASGADPAPSTPSRRPLLLTLAIGLAVGIAGTAAVHAGTAPTPRPDPVPKPTAEPGTAPVPLDVGVQLIDDPSLARFDVPETEADIPPEQGWLELLRTDDPDAEVRLLGSYATSPSTGLA